MIDIPSGIGGEFALTAHTLGRMWVEMALRRAPPEKVPSIFSRNATPLSTGI
jgi:hypothetical protein